MAPFRISQSSFLVVCLSGGHTVSFDNTVLHVYFSNVFIAGSPFRHLRHTPGKGNPDPLRNPSDPDTRVSLAWNLRGHPLFRTGQQFDHGLVSGTLVYSFFRGIFTATKVTSSLICATLCLYLIIGLLWAALFSLLESTCPGSFSGGVLDHAGSVADRLQSFVYFSFITLTTLGYGDITPQTQGAGALCQAEAIVGQFFMAILVARFVSMYGSNTNVEDS